MRKLRELKKVIASIVVMAMLFTCSSVSLYADEVPADGAKAVVTEEEISSPSILKDDPKYDIEVNQGFSFHVEKDQLKSGVANGYSYLKNFIAGKETVLMVTGLQAKTEEEAKNEAKNLSVVCKTKEGEEKSTWNEFEIVQDYDDRSSKKGYVAIVKLDNGIEKGNYTFVVKNGENEAAKREDVDFYNAKPLNILAVPVTAYYSESANVDGGGCPADKKGQGVPCDDDLWNKVKEGEDSIERYLLDVYPVSKINVDFGNTFDGGSAEYDMCDDAGQKKLWEDVSKLQTKDKEGKDKYDIILAFVMYRQDKTGTGQGYTFGRPTNIITLTDKDMLPTVAHEIAHCYGVGDEYDGGSYNYRVNNVPLEYKSTGRDKITSEAVSDTTDYTKKGVSKYENVTTEWASTDYYWLSSSQFKSSLKDNKVCDGDKKDKINENGNGTVIDPALHPFILSKKEFVHFAETDKEICPTISYMGSGYSGNQNYYFTTSVIWEHLFNEFLEKEKKEEQNNSEQASTESLLLRDPQGTVSDDEVDLYYDDECRFGESRMAEVSGSIEYDSKAEDANVESCEVEPIFSYNGDLELVDYMDLDGDEKDTKEEDLFVFAAVDKNGKVITSPVDGEKSIVIFYGGNFVQGMPAPTDGMADKRFQDFCEFSFDAEYPEGTDRFIIVKKSDYDANGTYGKKASDSKVLWERETPDKVIDGGLLYATEVSGNDAPITLSWNAAAYDADDYATTSNLYTMVYYAPQGEQGEIYYVKDGDYEKDFGAKDTDGDVATITFDPKDYLKKGESVSNNAYVWIKVSDGVNGLDIYSDDELITIPERQKRPAVPEKTEQEQKEDIVKEEAGKEEKTQVLGDTLKMTGSGKTLAIAGLEKATGQQKLSVNAGSKFTSDAFKNLDITKATVSSNDGTPADVKKLLKVNKKKGQLTVKPDKNCGSCTFMIPVNEDKCTLVLTVVNVGFDKNLKKKTITAATGDNSTVSVNLVKMNGKTATANDSDFLSAEWFIDGKTAIKTGDEATTKKGLKAVLSKDNRTLTISSPDSKKGSVKIKAVVNGKAYTTTIKAKF